MSTLTYFFLISAFCVTLYNASDLQVGSTLNGQLGYQEIVKLGPIPFTTRTKNVFYNSNNTKTIKGLTAIDIDKSNAEPVITVGGVGMTYVNVRIKSERGEGLNYLVQIFV